MPLAQLPPATVKLIGSSQVITSVSSVVKELMENSIDSGAGHIEIKLDKHGLEKIEVKDDGCGVAKSDVTVMCLSSYTSKISDFSDLDSLSSYGFRGEALSALCNVAEVSVTTKTTQDDTASCYSFDHNGQVKGSKISHIAKGTIITVNALFKNLPVRRQLMSNAKRAAEELKKVEKVVKSLAVVHPRLRVTLVHNKFLIWQKVSVANLRQSVMQILSLSIVKQLHHILENSQQVRVEMLVPSRDCDVSCMCFSNFSEASYLFINNRPVRHKEIEQVVYSRLSEYFGVYVPAKKYPISVLSLTLSSDCLDVNLEPNKTRVYLKNQEDILDFVKQCLHLYYGEGAKVVEEDKLAAAKSSRKRKVESEPQEVETKKIVLENKCQNKGSEEIEVESSSQTTTEGCVSQDSCNTSESTAILSQQDLDDSFERFCLERNKEMKETKVNCPSSSGKDSVSDSKIIINNNNNKNPISSNFLNHRRNCDSTLKDQSNQCFTNGSRSSDITEEDTDKANHTSTVEEIMRNGNNFIGNCSNSEEPSSSTDNTDESESILLSFPLIKEKADIDMGETANNIIELRGDEEIQPERSKTIIESDGILESSNKIENFKVGLCSPTLSQWSRGEVTTSTGTLVEGPRVLADSPQTSQALSNRSVSSQMGCKEMAAFTKFARSMRKQILESEPDMSFTRVAQQLQMRWRILNSEEKKKYEDVMVIKKDSKPNSDKEQKTQTVLKVLSKRRPNIEVEVDMQSLKQMVNYSKVEQSEICLVGQLEASPLWIYHHRDSGMGVFSIIRLQEAVKFHQHLASFALPVKLLDESIPVTSREIGQGKWSLLLSLERSPNGVIRDSRLISNGFFVEILEACASEMEEVHARITYVPQNISYCGVEELEEILGLLENHGTQSTLAQCRPLKVISFIRSEVMRECSRLELPTCPDRVSQLLSYWLRNVASYTRSCIHYHPVTHLLDLP